MKATGLFIFLAVTGAAFGQQPTVGSIDLAGPGHHRCRDNQGGLLPATEFIAPVGPFLAQFVSSAVTMGSTINATITYVNPGTIPVSSTTVKLLYDGVLSGPVRSVSFNPPIPPGGTRTVTTQLGPFPSAIDDGTAVVLTEVTGIPLKVYLTYGTPVAQMAEPWVGVLDRVCRFANGQNQRDPAIQATTFGYFYSQEAAYSPLEIY
jgi:hypothetical protein